MLLLQRKLDSLFQYVLAKTIFFFTFSSQTVYVKRERIVIAWLKKKSLLLTNVHVLYVLEDKTSKKNFRLSVCLPSCTYVDFRCRHNIFRRS